MTHVRKGRSARERRQQRAAERFERTALFKLATKKEKKAA